LSADVNVTATIDNNGEPLSIEVGLDSRSNYYISSNQALRRTGFKVVPFAELVNEISVVVKGQILAEINAEFLGGLGNAYIRIQIRDLNSMWRKH
jgi:hypothetical protein